VNTARRRRPARIDRRLPRRLRGRAARLLPVAGIALLLCASPPAFAQETREYDLPELEKDVRKEISIYDLVKVGFKASTRFVGLADFGDYKANSYQPEARLKITSPIAKNMGLRLMATGRILHYDFVDGDADLGIGKDAGHPFGNLYNWSTRLQGAYLFGENQTLFFDEERWSLMGETFARAGWEEGANMTDALTGGVSLAAGYRLGRTLELAAGVSVRSNLRGEVRVRPLAEFDWRINPNWKISSQGLGLQVQRKLGERFTVFARSRWEGSGFRMADRGREIGKANLRIRQLPVGLGLWWNITRHVRVTTLAGVMAIHRLRVEDEDGNEIDTDRAKPSPYFLVRLDFKS